MSKSSEAVKEWRKNTKEKIIQSMGGCCQICGYDRCFEALEIHHLDPSEKDFSFSKVRANSKSWLKIVEELKKCVLLCANCHRELHNKKTQLPKNFDRFNEEFIDYSTILNSSNVNKCPYCGKFKPKANKFCSLKCSSSYKKRVDWGSVDLEKLLTEKPPIKIADDLNISLAAVKKRMKKLGLS